MMKGSRIILYATMAVLTACDYNDESYLSVSTRPEITGIEATIDDETVDVTRAVSNLKETVGRSAFMAGDQVVFTTIKRTQTPLTEFTYSDIRYDYTSNKSWERAEGNLPEKIYWSDGASAHTFTGYSLPSSNYLWIETQDIAGGNTYAGELGYGKTELNFTTGNEEMAKEDLLLTHNTNTVAETGGLSTKVKFTHALSNVRVVVNIKNFAASAGAVDTRVGVSDMVLLNQPTKYTWGANSSSLHVLDFNDAEQTTKDIRLWCPNPSGEGTGQSKTFTFYGLTTPQDNTFHKVSGNNLPLQFSFTVTYPNPMNPNETLTHTYQGAFSKTPDFNSGMCTTLNISLNHKDEQMYTDVSYSDWYFVSTPDLGELRKKSTFLDINSTVTIHTDSKATIHDATWLYKSGNQLKDIYGNDGTKAHPYRISTASQLLSFAKEVNNTDESFIGKFIYLDADITLQSSTAKTSVEDETSKTAPVAWTGIGNATHAFQGTFLGGDRFINRLYGSPLFVNVGNQATIESLQITTIGHINGGGALAEENEGIIAACRVIDDVQTNGGALVGTNNGAIYASYHTGDTHGTAGLVHANSGHIIGCYQAGDVIGGTAFSIAHENTGTINCPSPLSLYEIQQDAFVNALNTSLEDWYKTHPLLTPFTFEPHPANYPSLLRIDN